MNKSIFLITLISAIAAGCTAPKTIETTPSPTPTPVVSPAAPPSPKNQTKPWREQLPAEDAALRKLLQSDPFLEGWLQTQETWVGLESPEALLEKGFFINAGLNHDGNGKSPSVPEVGSCSLLRQDGRIPAMICGKSAMTWQWGIQSEDARAKVLAVMNPPEPVRVSDVAENPANFQWAKVFAPPSNCRTDAGKEFPVRTTFTGVSDVEVDTANPRANAGSWYREARSNCWIHESQIQFETVTTQDQSVETGATPRSGGSGLCATPDDVDSRGRRCGRRAASVRQGGR